MEPLEARTPVLTGETLKNFPTPLELDRQWSLITETLKQEIIENSPTRQAVSGFITTPLSESLPSNLLTAISQEDPRLKKILTRYEEGLGQYLALPPVPDELLKPDITYAPYLIDVKEHLAFLQKVYGNNTNTYNEELASDIRDGIYKKGVTTAERSLVATRYRFARDLKILALGAELLNQETAVQLDTNRELTLPSGTKIVASLRAQQQNIADLLNPLKWRKRRQLKDRVYEVYVDGRTYILKERKTARHTDTKRKGHVDGNTAEQEFRIAEQFQNEGTQETQEIIVDWETPLGHVAYPDGYQFTLYEHEEGIADQSNMTYQVARAITEHRNQFEKEFKETVEIAPRFFQHPRISQLSESHQRTPPIIIRKLLGISTRQAFTFEDFALVKAYRLQEKAKEFREKIVTKLGHTNNDLDGYAFQITSRDGLLKLKIFGFDFEYFRPIPPDKIEETLKNYEAYDREFHQHGLNFGAWQHERPVTKMEAAAYCALLAADNLMDIPTV